MAGLLQRQSPEAVAPPGSLPGAVARFLDHPEEGIDLLLRGRLEVWLRAIGEERLAETVQRAREAGDDGDVGLQKFMEATGTVEPPALEMEADPIELGALVRGEIRTVKLEVRARGRGLLWGEATVRSEFVETLKPRRTGVRVRAGEVQAQEFVVFTQHLPPGSDVAVPVRVATNGGEVEVMVRGRVEARPATLSVATRTIDAVISQGGPSVIEVPVRNEGDLPMPVSYGVSEPWLRVGSVPAVAPGGEERLRIEVDAGAIPSEDVRHRRKGDRYSTATVRVETPRETVSIEVRAWAVRAWDRHAFGFGLVAGLVPFVNLLLGSVLAADRIRRGRAWKQEVGRSYRCLTEARENRCFLIGMIPGVLMHLLTVFGIS